MARITVEAKVLGRSDPVVSDWAVNLPEKPGEVEDRLTLRDLIERIVRAEVDAFRVRQRERRLVRVLSPVEIERGAAAGKIDAGGHELPQDVDPDAAVATALQGFVDGIFFVFVDRRQSTDLDEEMTLRPGSRVTFLRLVALAGG